MAIVTCGGGTILDILQNPDSPSSDSLVDETEEETLISISKVALDGVEGPRTIRMCGLIDDQEILILLDSGSSHSFISTSIAAQIKRPRTDNSPITVRIVDGGLLNCSQQFTDCDWWVQGRSFQIDLRIIKLGCLT